MGIAEQDPIPVTIRRRMSIKLKRLLWAIGGLLFMIAMFAGFFSLAFWLGSILSEIDGKAHPILKAWTGFGALFAAVLSLMTFIEGIGVAWNKLDKAIAYYRYGK